MLSTLGSRGGAGVASMLRPWAIKQHTALMVNMPSTSAVAFTNILTDWTADSLDHSCCDERFIRECSPDVMVLPGSLPFAEIACMSLDAGPQAQIYLRDICHSSCLFRRVQSLIPTVETAPCSLASHIAFQLGCKSVRDRRGYVEGAMVAFLADPGEFRRVARERRSRHPELSHILAAVEIAHAESDIS